MQPGAYYVSVVDDSWAAINGGVVRLSEGGVGEREIRVKKGWRIAGTIGGCHSLRELDPAEYTLSAISLEGSGLQRIVVGEGRRFTVTLDPGTHSLLARSSDGGVGTLTITATAPRDGVCIELLAPEIRAAAISGLEECIPDEPEPMHRVPCDAIETEHVCWLEGVVIDASGAPVRDAMVSADASYEDCGVVPRMDWQDATDSAGRFSFTGMPCASTLIVVRATRASEQLCSALWLELLPSGEGSEVTVSLEPR